MEVKEAIKHLKESAKVNFDEGFYEYHDKEKEIIALLKSLEAENKKLKKENETYKGMWEMLSGIANRETDTSFESELFSIITRIENHYLGGGE